MMILQDRVNMALDNKETYISSSREEFQKAIKETGYAIEYKTSKGQLVALGVYISLGYDKHNYSYDIGFEGEQLLKNRTN